MNLEFTATETITRNDGQINQIHYQFEEFTVENVSLGITNKQERRSRIYDTYITREQYKQLAKLIPDALSFDNFVLVLHPFIIGYYQHDELARKVDINTDGNLNYDEFRSLILKGSFRAPIFASGPQKEGFDLGWKRNFQETFGTNIFKA
ncbi:unnamed protein product [Rotaria sp. Silwood1]|nr:unnamed protein product [Rotaria sp. Silwood1]